MSRSPRNIVLVFGGQSPEHAVSIESAFKVAEGLDRLEATRVEPVYLAKDGLWHWPLPGIESGSPERVRAVTDEARMTGFYEPEALSFVQSLLRLASEDHDAVFIMIHGAGGEDGRLQAALELADVRYTGSGPEASALALDKSRSQVFLAARDLPVPEFLTIDSRLESLGESSVRIAERLGLPCVIKPALGGSSLGLGIADRHDELEEAMREAFKQGPTLLVERLIRGREFTCGVLDAEGPRALPITEIIPPDGRYFDYDAKYTPGVSREVTPAEIEDKIAIEMQRLAIEAHRAIGCEGFSRTDFMLDDQGVYIIEINTIPGMTQTSLLPQAAGRRVLSFPSCSISSFVTPWDARRGAASPNPRRPDARQTMARIPDIPYEEIQPLLGKCFHKARSRAQADLFAVTWEGREALVKDYSGRPWLIRRFWGRIVLGREFRALRRLQDIEGIPRLLASAGPYAIVMERLKADRLPRNRETAPQPEFFDRATALVKTLHERGIGHGDLRRMNILIDADERPYLIDFATSVTSKPGFGGIVSRFVYRRYAVIDRVKMARIKSDFHPEALTDEERAWIEHSTWYLHVGKFFKRRVYRLKKPHHRKALRKRFREWLQEKFGGE